MAKPTKQLNYEVRAPRMKAVRRAHKEYGSRTQHECPNCMPVLQGMGWCKKHTPFHTIAHMGFARWLWVWVVKSGKMIVVTVLPIFVKVVVAVAIVIVVAVLLNIGFTKSEVVTCNKLKRQSQTYAPHFYLTQTEKVMCDDLGVS